MADFRTVPPKAETYVFDNNSSDGTAAKALAAGAHVFKVKRQGKGFVVGSMLVKVDADF